MATEASHALWVRLCHWVLALGVLTLAFTGVVILAAHPRLYWGEAGNDLMPALLEIPISNAHQPEGWQQTVTFGDLEGAPFSANRNYVPFNQNGWSRSLHFLTAWIFVAAGILYVAAGLVTGHAGRDLLPRLSELAPRTLFGNLRSHLRPAEDAAPVGPPYHPLQKTVYAGVAFVALPLMVATGLTMAPAVTAAWPFLLDIFGGYQSARTIHFFTFAALMLFLLVHVATVVATGLRRQLRGMILGN